MKRFAMVALAVLCLGLGFHLGAGVGKTQTSSDLVDVVETNTCNAWFAVLANGDVYYSYDIGRNWDYVNNVFDGSQPRSLVVAMNLTCNGLVALCACGDVYLNDDPGPPYSPWTYQGNVFGNGPSATKMETWGRLKGQFRQ